MTADARLNFRGSHFDQVRRRGYAKNWRYEDLAHGVLSSKDQDVKRALDMDMKAATLQRRFARTKKGYMGLVHTRAKEDDLICALYGGQVLYVLREIGPSEHLFTGECYVHGLMDGEVFESFRIDSELDTTTFVLV